MFDKRLFQVAPGIGRLIAGKVLCMWIGLLANIVFVGTLVMMLSAMVLAADPHSFACDAAAGTDCSTNLFGIAAVGVLPGDMMLYAGVLIACALVRYITTRLAARCGTEAAERVKLGLRERLYRKMLALGPSYSSRVKTADVVQSAGEGVEQIQSFFELFLPQLFYAILAPITLFAVIAPLNMPTAVTLLVCAPLIVIVVGLVAMSASRAFKKYWGRYTDMGAAFLDNLQGLETLKTFDADAQAAERMDEKAESFRVMTMRVLQIQLRSLAAMDAVAYGGTAAGIGVALWQYAGSDGSAAGQTQGALSSLLPFTVGASLSLAGVLLIVLLSADFFIPLRQLGSYFHVAMNGMTSTKRIFALLDAPEPAHGTLDLPFDAAGTAHESTKAEHHSASAFDIEFSDVSYAYPASESVRPNDGDKSGKPENSDKSDKSGGQAGTAVSDASDSTPAKALSDVSFAARPGQLTAIVGVSGSGKSTAAALLAGQITGYDGSISIAGMELADLNAASLTRAVTLVGARSHLFAGSLRENLLMADPAADDDRLWEALERARVADFVRAQPAGLDMPIAADSANLSGGQRQRIAIARALLHNSAIMVFDEATSSVDVESEALILASIRELADRGATVIMITHRMANAVEADRIVVFSHGAAVETGTHAELIAADGAYATLHHTQQAIESVSNPARHADRNLMDRRYEPADATADPAPTSPAAVPESMPASASASTASRSATIGTSAVNATSAVASPEDAEVSDAATSRGGQQPDEPNTPTESTFHLVSRLLKEATPLAHLMTAAVVSGTVGHLAATFLPVFGVIAAFALAGNPVWGMGVAPAVIAMVVCALLRGLMRYVEQYLNHNVAFRLLALFRSKAFAALRRLAPAKLAGKGKGDLIALVTTDVELLEIFFAHTISPVAIAVATSVVYALVLLTLSPWLALLLVVSHLIIGVVVPRFFATGVQNLGPTIRRQSSSLDDAVLDDMRGLDEIIRFGRGESRVAGIVERTKALWAEHAHLSRVNAGFAGIGGVLVLVLTAAAAAVAIAEATVEPTNIPALVTAVVLLSSSFGPTLALSALPANLTQTFASARRLFALMDEAPAVSETGLESPAYTGMAMEHVDFAYESGAGEKVLDDFGMEVPRYGVLGVQGPSGRGKSTTLKLLMRYWDPQGGRVALSGTALPQVDAHHRRRVQTMMSQETHLFDGTIRENLLIALPEGIEGAEGVDGANGAEGADGMLREALRKASVLDLVDSLPEGLDTQVGELGDRLSEGERQRIGLARIFLRDADLVLFDEPTSRLDALNEAVILQSINDLARPNACERRIDRDGTENAHGVEGAHGAEGACGAEHAHGTNDESVSEGMGNPSGKAVVLVSHRESAMRIADTVLTM
ncbi:ABC transporter ATP-binding protein [Bifidobacterium lemurum]|uniref:ABC transporter ATP-binding protein n=1 Tax=Bifidobacterium lemurum TaxID=1603886 RepID=A0A261FRC2_9BIFI|nr:ATP-binding cassette domain-containing protein [Bifidobacterium lemurum]OZG61356.1 ABC transporter ATP-binding protein [Bifidobacterium lemurum]QOL34740.1 ATP-binding cassette domain-containing protein [Bifidobacterium lemurum]